MAENTKLSYTIKHVDGVMHLDTDVSQLNTPTIEDVRIHPPMPVTEDA